MRQLKTTRIYLVLLLFIGNLGFAQSDAYEAAFDSGMVQLHTAQYEDAAALFSRALRAKPADASAHYQRARAYTQAGNKKGAMKDLYASVDNDTEQVIPYDYLVQDTFFQSLKAESTWPVFLDHFTRKVGGDRPDLFVELMDIRIRDQRIRNDLYKMNLDGLKGTPAYQAQLDKMDQQDSLNLVRITNIIDAYGYPSKKLVGRASAVAWLVIQHADLATQKKYLPVLQEAADRGDIGKGGLAMTIDRIRLGEGNKQIYGTQYREDPKTGRFVFRPLEDPDEVDERRASMGMGPIQEYAERNDITWPIEKINQQMNALTLHGKLTAKAGKGAALADLLLRAADLVSEAKGCRLYLISQDPEAPENIWVTEIWDSAEDHQASLQIPAVRALIEEAMPLLDGQPQRGQRLTMLGGHGLKTGN